SSIMLRRIDDDVELARLRGLGTPTKVPQLLISANGRWLAGKVSWRDEETRKERTQVLLWDLGTEPLITRAVTDIQASVRPEPVLRVPAGGEWFRADFDVSHDGATLAVAGRDDSILLYGTESAEPLEPLPPEGTVQSLAFHPFEHKL